MLNQEIVLNRNCPATIIPMGDAVVLEKGTMVTIKQALGGTVTVTTSLGLFRIATKDLDALGNPINEEIPKDINQPFNEALVWQALKSCYDPEIPINIVDLGLIYDLVISSPQEGKYDVAIKMTLTAQGCGMGPVIAADAKEKIEALPSVRSAKVDIVWDPLWNPMMISEEGKVTLGLN